jgi:ligand-binding SRPBCC domain-containing protein
MAFYQFQREQYINASIDELWDFISSPMNLREITPKKMGFEIRTLNLPDKIYEGMIISYIVRPLFGIPTKWVTEITHIQDKSYFVDEQRVGPYKLWHHQHIILPKNNGALMKDIVSYRPPFGLFGRIANTLVIRNTLDEIFDYRTKALEKMYPL